MGDVSDYTQYVRPAKSNIYSALNCIIRVRFALLQRSMMCAASSPTGQAARRQVTV